MLQWKGRLMNARVRFIDTHLHLASVQFDDDRSEVITRALDTGVAALIEIGYDLASSHAAIALANAHPAIFAVVGIQPNHLHDLPPDWIEQIRALASHPKVVAIGEIGLDFYWMKSSPSEQEAAFRQQLALAGELGLPVVIHSRDAMSETIAVLRDAARGPGVIHSFSGDWEAAQACLELGFYLSFSGPLTFPKSTALHDVARQAPVDRLLIETDSPYLSPHPHRGQRNEPSRLIYIGQKVAELRQQSLAELAPQLWHNAMRAFPRLAAAWE
ncbi:hydrolase, TatD family [Chloroflexus aggregans DSM 9485]|uniref:Hydrolase, TatD family n=2 Tax=Chloroflexus aggregans TaxID=152260 RepID=B8G565_CHLAD|nr:hydrolase, TatD family [Chloroflexus aggregans DSM 9485]